MNDLLETTDFEAFLESYYAAELATVDRRGEVLAVKWRDLYGFDPQVADAALEDEPRVVDELRAALEDAGPIDDAESVLIQVTNRPDVRSDGGVSQRRVDVVVKKTRHGSIMVASDPSADSGMRIPTDAEREALEKLKAVKQTIDAEQYENHEKVGEFLIRDGEEPEFCRCGDRTQDTDTEQGGDR